MKKLVILASMFLAISSVVFTGCKKGEEDPSISLKSRDGRLKRAWKLDKIEGTEKNVVTSSFGGSSSTATETITTSYNGALLTETNVTTSGGTTDTETNSVSLTADWTFEDRGVFTANSVVDGESSTSTGNWAWVDSDKNKLFLMADGDMYEVVGLSSDELILRQKSSSKDVSEDFTSTSDESTTYTLTAK